MLASGEVLDIGAGTCGRHPTGTSRSSGARASRRVPAPRYRMPEVAKRSAGYFAEPGMDLIDLFIGSEGTLGVIVEATLALNAEAALDVVWRSSRCQPNRRRSNWSAGCDGRRSRPGTPAIRSGLDVSAIEFLDRRCLEMLREDGADRRHGITIPPDTEIVLLVQIELAPGTTAEIAYDQIAGSAGTGRVRRPARPLLPDARPGGRTRDGRTGHARRPPRARSSSSTSAKRRPRRSSHASRRRSSVPAPTSRRPPPT